MRIVHNKTKRYFLPNLEETDNNPCNPRIDGQKNRIGGVVSGCDGMSG